MLVEQQQSQLSNTENEIFNQIISSYNPLEGNPLESSLLEGKLLESGHLEDEPLTTLVIEEDTSVEELPDDFITRCQLTGEQLDLNMALCREFEGEE